MALLLAATASIHAAELDQLREQANLLALREPVRVIDFELEDLAGKKVKLSSFEGTVVVLNFWATWCPPCRAEIPSMQALYEKLSRRGLEIVAVNLQEDRDEVRSFVKEYRMTFPVLLDTTGEIGAVYGATNIPTSYVIDREGFAVSGVIGSIEWNTSAMERYLLELLAQK